MRTDWEQKRSCNSLGKCLCLGSHLGRTSPGHPGAHFVGRRAKDGRDLVRGGGRDVYCESGSAGSEYEEVRVRRDPRCICLRLWDRSQGKRTLKKGRFCLDHVKQILVQEKMVLLEIRRRVLFPSP